MHVRRERPGDEPAVAAVHGAAFQEGDATAVPVEVRLVEDLRRSSAWLPRLSLVVEVDDHIVGHVVCSRAVLLPAAVPVLGLAPIGVHPHHQRRGLGSALMHAIIGAAEACDEPLIGLVGDPRYYRRFGFQPASRYGIEPADASYADYFQVRVLTTLTEGTGEFHYADAFARI